MKYLFLGNGDYAVRLLRRLHGEAAPLLVITYPPKPMGRGRRLRPSPVRETAEQWGIPFLEREYPERSEMISLARELSPSLILVADFGRLIEPNLLNLFPGRWLNLHPSLLPRWRGPAPIRRCLMAGENETGVTLMVMNERLDEGEIIMQSRIRVGLNDDFHTLSEKLAEEGASIFIEAAPLYLEGNLPPKPQTGEPSYARALVKEESLLRWNENALSLHNKVRALNPGPGTYTFFRGKRLKILSTTPHPNPAHGEPGELRVEGRRLFVNTGGGSLEILLLQPEGRRPMEALDFLKGYRPRPGEKLG